MKKKDRLQGIGGGKRFSDYCQIKKAIVVKIEKLNITNIKILQFFLHLL